MADKAQPEGDISATNVERKDGKHWGERESICSCRMTDAAFGGRHENEARADGQDNGSSTGDCATDIVERLATTSSQLLTHYASMIGSSSHFCMHQEQEDTLRISILSGPLCHWCWWRAIDARHCSGLKTWPIIVINKHSSRRLREWTRRNWTLSLQSTSQSAGQSGLINGCCRSTLSLGKQLGAILLDLLLLGAKDSLRTWAHQETTSWSCALFFGKSCHPNNWEKKEGSVTSLSLFLLAQISL